MTSAESPPQVSAHSWSQAQAKFLEAPLTAPETLFCWNFCELVQAEALGIKKFQLPHGKGMQNTRCFVRGPRFNAHAGETPWLIDVIPAAPVDDTDVEAFEPLAEYLRRAVSQTGGLRKWQEAHIIAPLAASELIEKRGFFFFKKWRATTRGSGLLTQFSEPSWPTYVERRIGEALKSALRPPRLPRSRAKPESALGRRRREQREKSQLETETSIQTDNLFD